MSNKRSVRVCTTQSDAIQPREFRKIQEKLIPWFPCRRFRGTHPAQCGNPRYPDSQDRIVPIICRVLRMRLDCERSRGTRVRNARWLLFSDARLASFLTRAPRFRARRRGLLARSLCRRSVPDALYDGSALANVYPWQKLFFSSMVSRGCIYGQCYSIPPRQTFPVWMGSGCQCLDYDGGHTLSETIGFFGFLGFQIRDNF